MQYQTGTVTVGTVGFETYVYGVSTNWTSLTSFSAGWLFKVQKDPDIYYINSIEDDTTLILSEAYTGAYATGEYYLIVQDYTPNLGIPLIKQGDVDWPTLLTLAMSKIDAALWRGRCKYLIFEPQDEGDVPAVEGVFYLDESSGRFRYYDGVAWRTLAIE